MLRVRHDLPTGTVTFLFTDVEGSTKLLHSLGAESYAKALADHRRVIREACAAYGGVEVDTQGDAFFFAFPTAPGALEAAGEMTQALASGQVQVRVGVHTGTPLLTEEGYVGDDVHLAARVAASAHGGQVVLSAWTATFVERSLLELGEHRLKDIAEPVSIFQLGDGRFPPLKTISNTNLPRPASSFVGREKEVEEVLALLGDGARLLTLTGPGGSGKTRLAIEAAAELVPEFRAGVFWVGLAALRDPALVTETIAQTLGAKDGLAEHIGVRELLLLLDNLEQVAEAAPELASLVERCPNLRLLVTSRELLRVRGEVEYPVPPLAEPEAVALFCARARSEPDDAVEQLCRALDNLPLALELAAGRASVLSPRQVLERLSTRLDLLKGGRDADPRQQTLRATIEWSYDLLSAEEQRLFARLAVFVGCTLEATEEVCEADLDALQSLVEKSLLRSSNERYWMLETIREYAAERLEESGEGSDLRERHARHFLSLAEEAEPNLHGSGSTTEWLDRLEREHDNIRAALDWFEVSGDGERALRLAGALSWFWGMRGYILEGRSRLEATLGCDERPTAARAKALIGAATMAFEDGDNSAARARAEQGLELHRALGDAWGTAYAAYELGDFVGNDGDLARARELFEESVRIFRELGDEHHTQLATRMLAFAYRGLGDLERARALLEENLRRARAAANEFSVAGTLSELAMVARDEGRVDDALSMLTESQRIWRDLGNLIGTVAGLSRIAFILAVTRRAETAARLLSSSENLNEEVGYRASWLTEMNEETLTALRAQLDEAAFAEAWEQGRKLSPDEAVALAFASVE
jgi:predicted ATPase/class 3 adenylate cyclase